MASNDTPHTMSPSHPRHKAGPEILLPKVKKPPVPMAEKIRRQVTEPLKQGDGIMYDRGRFRNATTGKAISLAVMREAYKRKIVRCADEGGLFPGEPVNKQGQFVIGQSWVLARG